MLDEHGAASFEVAYDVQVVDDLLAHVDGRSVQVERSLDRLDGALDAGAVAAGGGQKNLLHHGVSLEARSREVAAPPG